MNNYRVWPVKDKEYHFKISIKSFDSGCTFTWNGEYFDLHTSLTLQEVRNLKTVVERAEEVITIYSSMEGPGVVDFTVGQQGSGNRNPSGILGADYPDDNIVNFNGTVDINGRRYNVTGGDFSNDIPLDAGLS